MKKASEKIAEKKSTITESIANEIQSLSNTIKITESSLMKDKLVDENCPPL